MLLPALAAALALSDAFVPQSTPGKEASQLPEVVVEGRLAEDLARDFIGEVAAAPSGAGVPRWRRSVCVGVVNLRPETAQFVIDRVAGLAVEMGLEPGEPGCEPQVVIVATNDGSGTARGLVQRRTRTFDPGGDRMALSRGALERFQSSDSAVRWWHLSAPVDPDTNRNVANLPGRDRNPDVVGQVSVSNMPQVTVPPTLLAAPTRQNLLRAIVIIDFSRVGEVDFDQLADYVAFVSLAQVDPEADTSAFPTILNVFDDPSTPPRLTDWDRAYLRGLYQSDDTAPTNAAREAAIRREMLRARAEGPVEAD